ncbi:ATP-binding cassette domain-containing protein [Tatumella sp. TA1]|nr:ATP-binding cassette domain-containing protein [Tatumella sp. TA1]
MLTIHDLHILRGEGADAHHVFLPQLILRPGEVLAITGESGCGKSTLLEAIGLLLPPHQLKAFSLQKDEHTLDLAQLLREQQHQQLAHVRASQLGFVLQNGGLLPYLSVLDNIRLPSQLAGKEPDSALFVRITQALKLESLLQKMPAQLSIGERQRTAFARAIVHRPCLLLADEPTAALDPENAESMFTLFLQLVKEEGMMALVVCHDRHLVEAFQLPCLRAHFQSEGAGLSPLFTDRGSYFVR